MKKRKIIILLIIIYLFFITYYSILQILIPSIDQSEKIKRYEKVQGTIITEPLISSAIWHIGRRATGYVNFFVEYNVDKNIYREEVFYKGKTFSKLSFFPARVNDLEEKVKNNLNGYFNKGETVDLMYYIDNPKEVYLEETYNRVKENDTHPFRDFFSVLFNFVSILAIIIITFYILSKKKNSDEKTVKIYNNYKLKTYNNYKSRGIFNNLRLRKNIPNKLQLEVIKVNFIDYEREQIFFIDENNMKYIYETDFGDTFKVGEKYILNFKPKLHKVKVISTLYNNENINAILLYNINHLDLEKV